MSLKYVRELLEQIKNSDIPISNTTRGEQVHQTHRNNYTTLLKEALYKDCLELFSEESEIIPYLTKEGVVLEVPNESIANNTDPNTCTGAISLEWNFTFKGLDFDPTFAAEEYIFAKEKKRKDEEERKRKLEEKKKKDEAARKAREFKRQRLANEMIKFKDEEDA